MANFPSIPGAAPLLIDAKAAHVTLCICKRVLARLSHSGAIPSYKVGRSRRFCPIELQAWVRAGCPTEPGAGDRIRNTVKQ